MITLLTFCSFNVINLCFVYKQLKMFSFKNCTMLYVPFKIYYSFNLINFLHVSKYPTKTLMTLSSISHHRTIIYLTKPLVFGHLSCISFFFFTIIKNAVMSICIHIYSFVQLTLKMNC